MATVPQRWLARLALVAAAAALLVPPVVAGLRQSLALVLVGLPGLALTLAGVWWALTNRGLVWGLAIAVAAAPFVVLVRQGSAQAPSSACGRTDRIPSRRCHAERHALVRRRTSRPQLLPHGPLDLFHRAGRIHRHDDFLGAEQLQDWPGLVVVVPQTALDRLRCVVGPGHQPAAAHVTHASHGRPVEDEVVVDPAPRAQPPTEDAVSDQLVGDLQQDYRVQVEAFQEEAGL
jgi:hypothetical protein